MRPRKIIAALAIAAAMAALAKAPEAAAQALRGFAPVVREVAPAVVNIYAKKVVRTQVSPFGNNPFFSRFFFGTREEVRNTLGSGAILSGDGLVVTSSHVIECATEIRVVLRDRREFEATVALSDWQTDLAVLRLEGAERLPTLEIRNSDQVEVGELALALGNPLGNSHTVSSGIVSALARPGVLPSSSRGCAGETRPKEVEGYFMQTDAPINPGNSGGPLVDVSGKLIGINTYIQTLSGGSDGIGFAVPSNLVEAFLRQAKEGAKRFQSPWLGFAGRPLDSDMAKALEVWPPSGVLITELHSASPMAEAGLEAGDVIVRLGGKEVNSLQETEYRMRVMGIGSEARVDYIRNGQGEAGRARMILPPNVPAPEAFTVEGNGPFRGLELARVNPKVISDLELPLSSTGVIVLRSEGPLSRLGLRAGDVIRRINEREIRSTGDAREAIGQSPGQWDVEIVRGGSPARIRFRG